MKIISKFTDFYEYDCYRYGAPDESLRWVRETKTQKYDERTNIKPIKDIIDKLFLCNLAQNQKLYTGKYGDGFSVIISEELIGIYPYLYYVPVLYYSVPTYYCGHWKDTKAMSIEDSIKCLTIPGYYKECMERYGINYKKYLIPEQVLKAGKPIKDFRGNGRDIINDSMIVENKEIFEYLKTPVFVIKYDFLDHARWNDERIDIITDCNLMEDTHILSAYPNILAERDIYNDIENFLWSQKQEPMSIPDNKTKILSHGFDLKTSFRKM